MNGTHWGWDEKHPPAIAAATGMSRAMEGRAGSRATSHCTRALGRRSLSPWLEQDCGRISPSSTGSRKEPERIIPLGLSARERVLPIWEVLYSSKVESWVGMLLERVIRGVVAAVGLTGRRRRVGGGEAGSETCWFP